MHPPVALTTLMRIDVGADGSVMLRHVYFSPRLTLGGRGWVDRSATFVQFSALSVAQEIAMRGHANDGANGRPRVPTLECPF